METCALVAASEFNGEDFERRDSSGEFDYVVAVDGGLVHLELVGREPDFILGDFDSLGYVPVGPNVETYPTHKDKSDLELAFDLVKREGFGKVVVYGALGGRLDHTLAALQTCAHFAESGLDIVLIDRQNAVKVLVGPASFALPCCKRGTVSVFSATDESLDVSEWGMEYPLERARLTNRTTLGLSNELIGSSAGVSVGEGALYIFYPL